MFDLTPAIDVPIRYRTAYGIFRCVLWIGLAALSVWAFVVVVFPNGAGYFDFRVYFGPKNTIASPRLADEQSVQNGRIPAGQTMKYNYSVRGMFSSISLRLSPQSSSDSDAGGTIDVVRAYRSLLYPVGDPVIFRDGSLLRAEGRSYIVSSGRIRMFASEQVLSDMGYEPEQFEAVSAEELGLMPRGEDIVSPSIVPEGKIRRIGEHYYQYLSGKWTPFVSTRAFLSRYRIEDAAIRPVMPDTETVMDTDRFIGFADGAVLSYGEAVYVVEGNVLRPVDSAETFLTKGYVWKSVIPATGEEFGMYTRGKLYTIREPHPTGTIYHVPADGTYYLVADGRKHMLRGEHLIARYASVAPVEGDISETIRCVLDRDWLGDSRCTIPIGMLDGAGAEYQFAYIPDRSVSLTEMSAIFIRDADRANWDAFLTDLSQRLASRYVSQ